LAHVKYRRKRRRTPPAPQKASLQIKDASTDSSDRVSWKWVKGDATTTAEFGDPLATHDYALCVFTPSGGRAAASGRAGSSSG
jgi:hypothetical protein